MSTASHILIGLEFTGWAAFFAWLGWKWGFERDNPDLKNWWHGAGMLAAIALIIYAFRTHQDNSTEGIYEAADSGISLYQIEAESRLIRAEGWVMFLFGVIALSIGWRKLDAIKKQKTGAIHPVLIGFSFVVILLVVGHFTKPERREAALSAKKDVPVQNATKTKKQSPIWYNITRDEDYQSLSPQARSALKQKFFDLYVLPEIENHPELKGDENVKRAAHYKFMQTPDDNGQGYISSLFGAFAQGFGLVIPYAIETAGQTLGHGDWQELGADLCLVVASLASVNPIHQEGIPIKTARVLGHVFFLYAAYRLLVLLKKAWIKHVRDKA